MVIGGDTYNEEIGALVHTLSRMFLSFTARCIDDFIPYLGVIDDADANEALNYS